MRLLKPRLLETVLVFGALCAPWGKLTAQCTTPAVTAASGTMRIPSVGSVGDDSLRLGSLVGACWGNGSLVRSSVTLTPDSTTPSWPWNVVLVSPMLRMVHNSQIPDSRNDGALWAGRGLNVSASAGFRAMVGRFSATLAPQVVWSQNRPFPLVPNLSFPIVATPNPTLSAFASPWHSGNMSADLPIRFGSRPYARIDLGESSVEFSARRFSVGFTSASQWWGPGIRNALVMSNNAAGIPHAFARSSRPLRLPMGDLELYVMTGGLQESPFFDFDSRNDWRAISAGVLTLRVAGDTGLILGIERAVYSFARHGREIPLHAADVFVDWHRAPTKGPVENPRGESDQLLGFFGRWVRPEVGFAVHGEWAIASLPSSIREILVHPESRQGYTVGLEWTRMTGTTRRLLVQGEVTNLEQNPPFNTADVSDFYVSHVVRQGFTHQGQSIGAAIGPGSSSQYLAFRFSAPSWQTGVFFERIRWEEGAYSRSPAGIVYRTHDVSLVSGLTAGHEFRFGRVDGRLTHTYRYNYLFQTVNPYLYDDAFNISNLTMGLVIIPRW